jgi:hypothetical protein
MAIPAGRRQLTLLVEEGNPMPAEPEHLFSDRFQSELPHPANVPVARKTEVYCLGFGHTPAETGRMSIRRLE